MITMISGSLGTGKTALAIKLLSEHEHYPSAAVVLGVRGWKGQGEYWELPSDPVANQRMIESVGRIGNTVYLVDEAKKIWPSRVAGRPVPEFIDAHLAESRSVGQDWIITCQAPGQIDVALRRLIGRHIHLEKTAFGIKYSEAGQCREDLKFSADESEKYTFPVESLKLYESAEVDTKMQKKGLKIPKRFYWLGGLLLVCMGIAGWFWSKSTMFQGAATKTAAAVAPGGAAPPSAPGGAAPPSGPGGGNMRFREKIMPRDFDDPLSAPIFDGVRPEPVALEVVGCVASASRCVCYSQQGTGVDMPANQCRDRAAGRYFDPYKPNFKPVEPVGVAGTGGGEGERAKPEPSPPFASLS